MATASHSAAGEPSLDGARPLSAVLLLRLGHREQRRRLLVRAGQVAEDVLHADVHPVPAWRQPAAADLPVEVDEVVAGLRQVPAATDQLGALDDGDPGGAVLGRTEDDPRAGVLAAGP